LQIANLKPIFMKLFYLFSFFTLLLSNTLLAQFKEGYIIKNNNDTIFGQIDFEGSVKNSDQCKFRALTSGAVNQYSPKDIKAFRFIGSKYFTSAVIMVDSVPRKVFLEWLIMGKASILSYTPSLVNQRYFIQMVNDSLSELQNTYQTKESNGYQYDAFKKEYIGELCYKFNDYPAIFPTIKRAIFSRNELIKIAKLYNEKAGENKEIIVFEKNAKKLKWEVGPSFGYYSSQLKLNSDIPEKVDPARSISYGLAINLSSFTSVSNYTSVSKLSFGMQLMYCSFLYTYDITGFASYYKTNQLFKVKNLRIPLQVNYKFSNKKFTPFVSMGVTTYFRLGYTQYDTFLFNYVSYDHASPLELEFFQLGINSGIGFEYSLSPKVKVSTKVEYERATRFFGNYPQDKSYNNNCIIQAAILYRIK